MAETKNNAKPGKNAAIRLPEKTTMNLRTKTAEGNRLAVVIPIALILAILIAMFCKFAVWDRINKLSKLREQYRVDSARLSELQDSTQDYNTVKEKYRRYSNQYLDGVEPLVDRLDILDLLKQTTDSVGRVNSVSIVDNSVLVKLNVKTLDDVARIRQALEASPYVVDVKVNTADRADKTDADYSVSASVLITVTTPEEEAAK